MNSREIIILCADADKKRFVNSFLRNKNVQNVPYITEYAKLLF